MYDFAEFEKIVYKLQEAIDNDKVRLTLGKNGYSLRVRDEENKSYFEDEKHSKILSEVLGFIVPSILRRGTDTVREDIREKADLVNKTILNNARTKEYMFSILATDDIIDSLAFQTIIKPHLNNKYYSGLLMINYTDISDEDKSIKFEVDLKQIENMIKLLTEAKEELTKYQEEL